MRTATCLTLLAVGAILTFAITGHPSFLNVQVAGLVVMATGVAGLLLPRRGQAWLRRRTVLRPDPARSVIRRRPARYSPYQLGPASGNAESNSAGQPADAPTLPDVGAGRQPEGPDPAADSKAAGAAVADPASAGSGGNRSETASSGRTSSEAVGSEVIDEYLQD